MPADPPTSRPPLHLVVMGVAGCGKTLVAARIASELGLPLVDADDLHPPGDIASAQRGAPLTDEDHAEWVRRLADGEHAEWVRAVAETLRAHPQGAVLVWAALRRADREALRAAVPGLHVLYLALTEHQAMERATARTDQFLPPSYVARQFESLEDPAGEPRVQVADAMRHVDRIVEDALRQLAPAFNNA